MSIPYTSEDFTTPRAIGESWIEYPFIKFGDNTSKVYHMRCMVNKDDYAPIALDTTMASASNANVLTLPFSADTNAYFVGDYNHRVVDGVLLEFDRQFATIPNTNEEYPGTEFFTFPGYLQKVIGSTITVVSDSYNNNVSTFVTSSNHNMVEGDFFNIAYSFIENSITYNLNTLLKCVSGTSGTTIKADSIIASKNLIYSSPGVQISTKIIPARDAINMPSNTKIINEYFLPGVSTGITNENDIPILDSFKILSSQSGLIVNDLITFNLTLSTIPNAEQYFDKVNNQEYLIKSCSINKYKGNIYVRQTKKIIAK